MTLRICTGNGQINERINEYDETNIVCEEENSYFNLFACLLIRVVNHNGSDFRSKWSIIVRLKDHF